MAGELWFDRLGEVLAAGGAPHAAPVSAAGADASAVSVRPFGPFDAGGGSWQFSTGLRFDMPAASPAKPLYAMATGTMRFLAGAGGQPNRVVLARGDLPSAAVAKAAGGLPYWYPPVRLIVYENVDRAEAKAAALAALGQKGETQRALKRLQSADAGARATAAELAEKWLADEIPEGIAVLGRQKVGACGASPTAGRVEATVRLVEQIEPAPTRFWNPAFLLALWEAEGWIPSGNDLLDEQVDTGGPIVSTGRLVFVAKAGSGTAPFDTPAKAAKTIPPAVGAAAAGDTVLILDSSTYTEAVTISKGITLTSTSTKKATDAAHGYPTIDGQNARRPITIQDVPSGVAHVSRLKVIRGSAAHVWPPARDKGSGGGILVDQVQGAAITSCHIRENFSKGGGIFAEGYGGGICSYHASPAIVGCLIESNKSQGRGAGVGCWGYGWPSIFDCVVRQNRPQDAGNIPSLSDRLAGNDRPDGGGIAITIGVNRTENAATLTETTTAATLGAQWDAAKLKMARANWARIVRCQILSNTCGDDGGGLYVSIASNVRIVDTAIRQNSAEDNGGGIRVTMRSELVLIRCTIASNVSNSASDPDESFAGGGISSRNTTLLKLRGTTVENNQSKGFAGGGIYFIGSDEGDLLRFWPPPPAPQPPDFDWNNVLLHPSIFAFGTARLEVDSSSRIRGNTAQVLPGRTVAPPDPGKGGGVYAYRHNGARRATRVSPTIVGPPIEVEIADVASLEASNVSSFADAKRIYVDDRAPSPPVVKKDTDLPGSGGFSYP
jgi:parallel beta helix pectate lyase-like protein